MATAQKKARSEALNYSPLEFCSQLQREHEASTSVEERKAKGQVFTPASVCRFMAGLFTEMPEHLTLLDAGAGIGSLTAAVCEMALSRPTPASIDVHLYETDPLLRPLLDRSMRHCKDVLHEAGREFSFSIYSEDFILEGPSENGPGFLFKPSLTFDAAILNPPYFKVGVDSPHAKAMADIIKVHTNIYALFMAKAAELLRPNGELVAITPRSFCNGLYFKDFRRWFFSRQNLMHVHLFECRRSTFDDVLQESVITLSRRSRDLSPSVRVTTSVGRDIPKTPLLLEVPTTRILRKERDDLLLNIPTSHIEAELLGLIETWPHRFSDIGLSVSTGPVVMFRTEEFLLDKPNGQGSTPLIGPHNVKLFETVWPLERKNKPSAFRVCPESMKHLIPSKNYVLLRRFTAKEEKRRLVASCFLASGTKTPHVAIENHVNYVYHSARELSEAETLGLAALLNSTLFDTYFRIMSGNTQVNATELRLMKFPSLKTIESIGHRVASLEGFPAAKIESLILEELNVHGSLRRHFAEATP